MNSREDSLRLNVLLASGPLAIRIDEGRMRVQGLCPRGEMTVRLNPNTRPDRYLQLVRALISGQVLDSPGGYPVYLRRWTRMGQMRDESLAKLLLLGEPEAVVAAVCSPGLDDELARRAWWAMEDAENARRMLANPAVAAGAMGPVLAAYLVDYLPFETEVDPIMESVRLVLQPGLVSAETRADLWRKSLRKPAYLAGFLMGLPDDLPDPQPAQFRESECTEILEPSIREGDPAARLLCRVRSAAGQTWLRAIAALLSKPSGMDLVDAAFGCLRAYFAPIGPQEDPDLPIMDLIAEAERFVLEPDPIVAELLGRCPGAAPDLAAMRLLSGLGYGVIRPVLPDPTALGSVMRRKLAVVLDPVRQRIDRLRGAGS